MTHISEDALVIRKMSADEVQLAIEWAGLEGWNPGLHDASWFYAADPDGFFVAEVEGKPVGCISAIRYGEDFGFLGLYIVLPEYRGNGYGIALWNAAIQHLSGRNIGLDGVVAQQANYKKSGFELAHRNVRYELVESGITAARTTLSNSLESGSSSNSIEVVPCHDLSFEKIRQFDETFFTVDRSDFLKCWINQQGATALAAKEGSDLRGYGVLRPCLSGCKIGPLFADSVFVAQLLLSNLFSRCAVDGSVYLDVPERNLEAVQLALDCGMQPMFETARACTLRVIQVYLYSGFSVSPVLNWGNG